MPVKFKLGTLEPVACPYRKCHPVFEAFPWETAPAYLVRDNDGAFGQVFRRRVRAMEIRDQQISPRSP